MATASVEAPAGTFRALLAPQTDSKAFLRTLLAGAYDPAAEYRVVRARNLARHLGDGWEDTGHREGDLHLMVWGRTHG